MNTKMQINIGPNGKRGMIILALLITISCIFIFSPFLLNQNEGPFLGLIQVDKTATIQPTSNSEFEINYTVKEERHNIGFDYIFTLSFRVLESISDFYYSDIFFNQTLTSIAFKGNYDLNFYFWFEYLNSSLLESNGSEYTIQKTISTSQKLDNLKLVVFTTNLAEGVAIGRCKSLFTKEKEIIVSNLDDIEGNIYITFNQNQLNSTFKTYPDGSITYTSHVSIHKGSLAMKGSLFSLGYEAIARLGYHENETFSGEFNEEEFYEFDYEGTLSGSSTFTTESIPVELYCGLGPFFLGNTFLEFKFNSVSSVLRENWNFNGRFYIIAITVLAGIGYFAWSLNKIS
ncbi:hypothetical protein DSAG12_00258 [Promethearchaeum syntrophicum]|uniref:Uncharacterized protein n=1 Tax=Promethearchaeum syntrophicum TaxID=2594042 RepID=A0A5B9D5Z5_9ARCH|nr:hypothetical protein [Candidatus Prometheoarchaeum syntrophicum]